MFPRSRIPTPHPEGTPAGTLVISKKFTNSPKEGTPDWLNPKNPILKKRAPPRSHTEF